MNWIIAKVLKEYASSMWNIPKFWNLWEKKIIKKKMVEFPSSSWLISQKRLKQN